VCVAAFAVLWAGGVATHWLGDDAARAGQGGIASLFLFLAGLIVLLGTRSRSSALALGAIALVGFAVEAAGVHSGVPFGGYEYTGELRPQLLGVPLVMGLAWMSLVAQAREVCARLRLPFPAEVVAVALWLTAVDLVIDPLAANVLNYWSWQRAGNYYGIPATNFAGWFATGLVAYALFGRRLRPNFWARVVGFAIVLFFALLALAHSLLPAALVGFTLCAAQLFLRRLSTVDARRPAAD
jgi:putative membrane protein